MDFRSYHKDRIKELIEANVQFDGSPLAVSKYRASGTKYPYIFLSSGEMGGFDLYDTGTYVDEYTYQINIVWNLNDNEVEGQTIEASVDELETLLVNFLRTKKARDSTDYPTDQNKWQDLRVLAVSAPYDGTEIQLAENHLVKSITIKILQPIAYVQN